MYYRDRDDIDEMEEFDGLVNHNSINVNKKIYSFTTQLAHGVTQYTKLYTLKKVFYKVCNIKSRKEKKEYFNKLVKAIPQIDVTTKIKLFITKYNPFYNIADIASIQIDRSKSSRTKAIFKSPYLIKESTQIMLLISNIKYRRKKYTLLSGKNLKLSIEKNIITLESKGDKISFDIGDLENMIQDESLDLMDILDIKLNIFFIQDTKKYIYELLLNNKNIGRIENIDIGTDKITIDKITYSPYKNLMTIIKNF